MREERITAGAKKQFTVSFLICAVSKIHSPGFICIKDYPFLWSSLMIYTRHRVLFLIFSRFCRFQASPAPANIVNDSSPHIRVAVLILPVKNLPSF